MKPGKNVRRQIVRDMTGEPVRTKEGAIVTWATPRGKAYPYNSYQQRSRDEKKAWRAIGVGIGLDAIDERKRRVWM